MGDKTGIEWADATWNPLRARNRATGATGWHCTHVTEACRNCYAEAFNEARLGTRLPYKPGHEKDVALFLDEKMLAQPLRWQRPRTIFVCSMTDLFADFHRDDWIDQIFAVMALAPQHRFLVLTKRPRRMRRYTEAAVSRIASLIEARQSDRSAVGPLPFLEPGATWYPLANVWGGVSVHDQRSADDFVHELRHSTLARRFVSYEPALGPVNFTRMNDVGEMATDALRGIQVVLNADNVEADADLARPIGKIDWVIAGGESGQADQAPRPAHPDWIRSARDQCAEAGTLFHFKQWGDWQPRELWAPAERVPQMAIDRYGDVVPNDVNPDDVHGYRFARVGKKAAGRTLDGRTHDDMPS